MFSEQVRIGSESSSKQLRNGPIHVTVRWIFGNDQNTTRFIDGLICLKKVSLVAFVRSKRGYDGFSGVWTFVVF